MERSSIQLGHIAAVKMLLDAKCDVAAQLSLLALAAAAVVAAAEMDLYF